MALAVLFKFFAGLKPGATKWVEPMALLYQVVINLYQPYSTQYYYPLAISAAPRLLAY